MSNQPSVGRTVHYQPFNSPKPSPAVILDIDGEFVDLMVFQPDGTTKLRRDVMHTSAPHEGCWNWPPRT